jgi:hypothetical protein
VALHDGLTGQHGQVQRPEVAGVAAVLPASAQTALGELEAGGLAAGSEEGNGRASYWSPTTPSPDADRAGDSQPGDGGGRGHGMIRLAMSWIEASPSPPYEWST